MPVERKAPTRRNCLAKPADAALDNTIILRGKGMQPIRPGNALIALLALCALSGCGHAPSPTGHRVNPVAPNPIPVTIDVNGGAYHSIGERVDGTLFVSGVDLYAHLPNETVQFDGEPPYSEFIVNANNGVWSTAAPILACIAGSPCIKHVSMRPTSYGPPAIESDAQVLIPIVQGLPFIRTTERGDVVTVTPMDWPGTSLPTRVTGATVGLLSPTGCTYPDQSAPTLIAPGSTQSLSICFEDEQRVMVEPVHHVSITFSVNPASPLRLALPAAPTPVASNPAAATMLVETPETPQISPYPSVQVYASDARHVAVGLYTVRIQVEGYPCPLPTSEGWTNGTVAVNVWA